MNAGKAVGAESSAPAIRRTIPRRTSWLKEWRRKETLAAWLFLLPALIGFVVFFAFPAVRGFYISLTDSDLLSKANFIGFDNYRELAHDKNFGLSLRVTVWYVFLNIPLQTFLALVFAVVFDRFVRGSTVRSILLLPWLMPNVVVALLFLWILDPGLGILNEFLAAIGLPRQSFLGSVSQAMPSIAGINIWRYVGYTTLLILAGMQRIPGDLYEAGSIDGASELRMFRDITLPLLKPVMTFVLVTSIVGSFQIFDTIAVTTQGGPVKATRVIYWFIYQHAFERYNFGYASAAAIVLFLILIIVSLIQMRVLRANESDLA
ncbi:MAG TPA: sugar ABC transporter permease [Thermomicrobiales bacterium]|nr:sugar ABC transporter permease [Thermomicrobiales bacterium]